MKSISMGFWSLTVAFGNLLIIIITSLAREVLGTGIGQNVSVTPTIILLYNGLIFVVAIAFTVICAFYKHHETGAAQKR